jgi:hypothetical protein
MANNGNPGSVEKRLRRIERTIPWLFVLIALLAAFLVITYLIVIFHIKRGT